MNTLQKWLAKLAGINPEPEAPQGPSPLEILAQENGGRIQSLEEELRQQRREMRRLRTALESLFSQQTGITPEAFRSGEPVRKGDFVFQGKNTILP